MTGTLWLVATPIGNLGDLTLRAAEVLKDADLIAAEDTRHSRILLEHYGIDTPVTSYHEHNKYQKAEVLIRRLQAGEDVALITDAGTPAVSDPGEVLVRECRSRGIPVTSVPGPCAGIAALAVSGFSTRRFCFEGFLPPAGRERKERLAALAEEDRTILLYEAPHRLSGTLKELGETLGDDRRVTVCRELTKQYEEIFTAEISDVRRLYEGQEPRGEYVLVIEGLSGEEKKRREACRWEEVSLSEHLAGYLAAGMDRKDAMKQMAKDRNCTRREIYQGLLGEDKE